MSSPTDPPEDTWTVTRKRFLDGDRYIAARDPQGQYTKKEAKRRARRRNSARTSCGNATSL